MLKKVFEAAVFLFFLGSVLIFNSCEVGLGSSVDVNPPEISITYPPVMSVIRGEFVLAGTCSDDQGVKSVSVEVCDSDGNTVSGYSVGDIAPENNGKTWKVTINTQDGTSYPLKDGKYTFNVSAKDAAGRVSGVSSRSFEIDNTAPFFIISSPAVTDSANSTEYGSVFKINGKIADDHDVRSLSVDVRDENGNSISGNEIWNIYDIDTAGGTSVTVARYFTNPAKASESEQNTTLYNRYKNIYGEDTSGDKKFKCSVRLEDSAREWIAPYYSEKTAEENTTEGNSTTTLWLNDDIYDELMGAKSSYQLEAGDLKKIWAGQEVRKEVLDILAEKKTDTSSKMLAFSLNKDASPTYSIAGYGIEGIDFGTNKAAKDGKVTFQALAGRDGILLKPQTFTVYLFGPFDSAEMTEDYITGLYDKAEQRYQELHKENTDGTAADNNKAWILHRPSGYSQGSVESYTQPVSLPSVISKNSKYIFVATGEDADGLTLQTSDGTVYGFTGESAGFAPTVEITSLSDNDVSNSVGSLVIKGTAVSDESGIASVAYEISVTDQLSVVNGSYKDVGKITGTGTLDSSGKSVSWKCEVSKGTKSLQSGYSSVVPQDGQMFIYNIKVTVTDDSALYTQKSVKLYADYLKPEPKIDGVDVIADNNVTPNVINGTVKLSGKVTEKNLETLVLSAVCDGSAVEGMGPWSFTDSSFEQEIDTTKFNSTAVDKNVIFTLTAKDAGGNEKSVTKEYTVNQESDRPVVAASDSLKDSSSLAGKWSGVCNGTNLFGVKQNNTLSLSISDDDGISNVILSVYDKNEALISSGSAKIAALLENKADGSASNPVTFDSGNIKYRVPATEGQYRIDIEAFDKEYDNGTDADKAFRSVKKSYYIVVNENNLIMRLSDINNDCESVKASEEHTVKGTLTLTDKSQLVSIERFSMKQVCSVCGNELSSCTCNPQSTEGVWKKDSAASAFYKPTLEEGEVNTITIPEGQTSSTKLAWEDKISASDIGTGVSPDSEKHFYYLATDVYGNTAAVELTCNVDGTVPVVNKIADSTESNWKLSSTQKIEVAAGDNDGSFNSGVSKVYYKIGSGDPVEMTAEYLCDSAGTKNSSGTFRRYSTTIDGLSEGDTNVITVYAVDAVENSSAEKTYNFKIDTAAPVVSSFSLAGSAMVKKNTDSILLNYNVSDVTSGIVKLLFSTDSNFKEGTTQEVSVGSEKSAEGSYSYSLSGLTDGSYNIYIKAVDTAGNKSDVSKTDDFIVDTTAPKVKITSHTAGATVNKKITLSGTVSDNNPDSTAVPAVYFRKGSSTDWTSVVPTDKTYSGQSWSCKVNTYVSSINTDESACDVYFLVKFTDLAGNVTAEDYADAIVKLNVDQTSDNPVIKFTNINLSGNASISSSKVTGVITDDDKDETLQGVWCIDAASYNSASLPSASNDNGWTKFTVEDGTGIISTTLADGESEGAKEWVLYVIDSEGTAFNSNGTALLTRPYFSDSTTSKKQQNTVSFNYDKTPPAPVLTVAHTAAGLAGTDSVLTYGPLDSLYVKVSVTEAVNMDSSSPVVLSFAGNTYSPSSSSGPAGNVYTYSFTQISLSTLASSLSEGNCQISVTAKDAAGWSSNDVKNIIFDKTAPVVSIIKPTTEISDAVTGAMTIKGIATDSYSSVSKLLYAIPYADSSVPEDNYDWKEVNVSASWEIKFSSGAEDSSESLLYYVNAKENESTPTYKYEATGTENIYRLPLYFKVTDSSGNTKIQRDQYVLVDSEGGKPKAWISSPEATTTTSGSVTVYGGASDDVSVSRVKIRYCNSSDGNLPVSPDWTEKDASGTNSWKYSIDTTGMNYVFVQCKAFDNDGKSREWTSSDIPLLKIDCNAPVIKNIKLVQYGSGMSGGTPVSELEYIAGMYISNVSCSSMGGWYLTADISDLASGGGAGNISSIEFTPLTSSTETNIYLEASAVQTITPGTSGYSLNIPLKTSDSTGGLSGQIYYSVKVTDNGGSSTTSYIKINVDSTAPSLYNTNNKESTSVGSSLRLKSGSSVIGIGSSHIKIENSNNFFTFGDTVSEGGSGLEYIAVSFRRNNAVSDDDDTDRIYNPMKTEGYTGSSIPKSVINRTKTDGEVYINSENLPALYLEGLTRSSEDSLTMTTADTNIRKGGLVKIGGSYRKITEVSGTTVKFSPTVSIDFTTAELIIAQIVDHQVKESVGSDLVTFSNDDGDCMVESVTQVGSSYEWTASIDSTNIPDGPVIIYVAAIDKAGNVSCGTVESFIMNSRPRIAKVLLGTDLNGDGKYTFTSDEQIVTSIGSNKTADKRAFGEFSYYSALDSNGNSQSEVQINSSAFKVISGLVILPEFVGGNTSLGYIMKKGDGYDTCQSGTVSAMDTKAALSSTSVITDGGSISAAGHISEFGGINILSGNTAISGDGEAYFGFTFWDKTEETIQGTDSQWALLKIPVTLKTNDATPPEYAKIDPFYWTSAVDNSVYQGEVNGIKGHIELEKDLTASLRTSPYGTGPKVSGQIIIRGSAYDDVRLKEISMSFENLVTSAAVVLEYTDGSWVSKADGIKVVSASGTDEYVSQEGHKMNFKIVVDTEELSGTAGINKAIRVAAADWKGNIYSYPGTTQTAEDSKTAYCKVDVVPYVTRVTTQLTEFSAVDGVFSRTAKGRYPVRESQDFTVTGYNLGTAPAVTLNGTSVGTTTSCNTGTSATSGELKVQVSSIYAVNNSNDNALVYNQQPNGVNNDTLTDDLYMDVWQFKIPVHPINGGAERVHMKINPSNGMAGFSFANSILYFNMPAYDSNQGDSNWGATDGYGEGPYSQIPVGMNYGGFSHNTFAYDKNGKSYGAAMCTDTQSAKASAFFQFFSQEAPIKASAMEQNMNYCNQPNASRLDSSTVQVKTGDLGWVTDINRIQSPCMETTYYNSRTYVYIAYYDYSTKQVRFRWGTVGSDSYKIDGERSTSNNASNSNRPDYAYGLDDIVDTNRTAWAQSHKGDGDTRPSECQDSFVKYSRNNYSGIPIQVIASSGVTGGINGYDTATTNKAGQYVSLSIVNKDSSSSVAVVSWYDSVNMKLCMAYNISPAASNLWTTRVIDAAGGVNVATAVDGNGGIHFAYYNNIHGSDLKYAYMPSYNCADSEIETVTVDSYGAVGAMPTIDVVNENDNWVPYISYQNNAYLGTPLAAKMAYRTDFTGSSVPEGAENDKFTGSWEITTIPSGNLAKNDLINIGFYKESTGAARASTGADSIPDQSDYTSNSTLNVCKPSKVYGNGTVNPMIGYGIETGEIEMAQKK